MGRLSDLGWGARLRALVAPEAADGPMPDEVAAAVVEVLKAWAHGDDGWAQRPAAVVAVGPARRPELVQPSPSGSPASAGCRCSARSRRPTSADAGPRGNSAQRVRALHDAFAVAGGAGRRAGRRGRPVLLVDDLVDSGWTMVLAGRALRPAPACCRWRWPWPGRSADLVGPTGRER